MELSACLAAVVFLIDSSASIADRHFAMQREGTAAAFEDPHVMSVIETSEGVAVLVADFAYAATTRVDWTLLRTAGEARGLAALLRRMQRVDRMGHTAIGHAIEHARQALRRAPCAPQLRVIDVSTDGIESLSRISIEAARHAAAAAGITVNALVFNASDQIVGGPGQVALMAEAEAWLRDNVVTGFLRVVTEPAGYAEAFRRKFRTEIARAPAVDAWTARREPSGEPGRRPP